MIRRKAEVVEPLKIAVLGFNAEQTYNAMLYIELSLEKTEDPVVKVNRPRCRMETKSGIIFEGIPTDDLSQIYGKHYDQLFIVGDRRWYTTVKRGEMIESMVGRLDENVPDKYKIQYMEV